MQTKSNTAQRKTQQKALSQPTVIKHPTKTNQDSTNRKHKHKTNQSKQKPKANANTQLTQINPQEHNKQT